MIDWTLWIAEVKRLVASPLNNEYIVQRYALDLYFEGHTPYKAASLLSRYSILEREQPCH